MKVSVLNLSVVFVLIFYFVNCGDSPTKYVGDSGPTKSGYIIGSLADSSSLEPLANVKIIVTEIYADSDYADTVTSNEIGIFKIGNIYEREYYLEINTKGYKCRTLLVNAKDTLRMENPVLLQRNQYPYEYFYVEEFPIEPRSNGYYYRIDPNYFYEDRSWTIPYDESPNRVSIIHRKLDSLTISLIRDDIKVDTLWYKFFQYECGAFMVEDKSDLVIKLKEDNSNMVSHNFIPYDFDISKWQNCVSDTTKMFARYYFFEQ